MVAKLEQQVKDKEKFSLIIQNGANQRSNSYQRALSLDNELDATAINAVRRSSVPTKVRPRISSKELKTIDRLSHMDEKELKRLESSLRNIRQLRLQKERDDKVNEKLKKAASWVKRLNHFLSRL